MRHRIHDVGAAKHIGCYSDAIEIAPGLRWIFTSGTPGVDENGDLPPGIAAQTRLVWKHIVGVLKAADMSVHDLVKVSTTLVNAADRADYVKVRSEVLGDLRPAFMLNIVTELIRPEVLVEVEIIAAAPPRGAFADASCLNC